MLDRRRDVDDIALLQAFRLDVRGERSVKHCRIEVGFTPEDRESLSISENIDNLVAAPNVYLMDRDRFRGGLPLD